MQLSWQFCAILRVADSQLYPDLTVWYCTLLYRIVLLVRFRINPKLRVMY